MKSNIVTSSLCALALSAFTAQAWDVSGVVSCPNGTTKAGIVVFIDGVGSTKTTGNGAYFLALPDVSASYTICVDPTTLPPDSSVVGNDCAKFSVDDTDRFATVDFTLTGAFCETNPPQGACWLTGGGTIGKTKGIPHFSFGGVVNPGCSPTAAGGGNWNVLDNEKNLHFKGLEIVVTNCFGVPTKSPKVAVNEIQFTGIGTVVGIRDNPMPETVVLFYGYAIDASEPGAGKDALYLNVYDSSPNSPLLLISSDTTTAATLSTGNLQIHTTSCQ